MSDPTKRGDAGLCSLRRAERETPWETEVFVLRRSPQDRGGTDLSQRGGSSVCPMNLFEPKSTENLLMNRRRLMKTIWPGYSLRAMFLWVLAVAVSRGLFASDTDSCDSRTWYILSQADTDGLLHGLPQRLARVLPPSHRDKPMWQGVDDGGRLQLDIRVRGDVSGEVFVGFFRSPQWWLAEPTQVRRFPGPGQYTLERLIPGKYQLGAMIGVPPSPDALGVHAAWPNPVEIKVDRVAEARVLVSADFQHRLAGHSGLEEGFAGQWEKMDPARTITVRTVDVNGEALPFCRVTFVDRDESTTRAFHEAGTDHLGYAYCDQIDSTFSLVVQRFDVRAAGMMTCWESRKMSKLYDARNRPTITIECEPFPSGRGRVTGQVRDQYGLALTEYYLTMTQVDGELHNWSDCRSFAFKVPVTDSEGRYCVDGLPAGTYRAMVRNFDYQTHVYTLTYSDQPKFTILPNNADVVRFDIEVEAKELRYGRAVYPDGASVYPGGWTIRFGRGGGDYFSSKTGPDGSFRVAICHEELDKLTTNSQGLVDVYTHGSPRTRVRVHIDKLSRNEQDPYLVVFPTREQEPAEDADERRPQADGPSQATHIEERDQKLNEFALIATDGRTHNLSDYRGHPILINVFTTWCGPCEQERPHLVEIQQEHADDGLVILAICCGEAPEAAERFARRHRLPFPVLIDESRSALNYDEIVNEKGRSGVPVNVLLDRDHHVVYADVGFNDEKLKGLREAIEEVLGNENGTSHKP